MGHYDVDVLLSDSARHGAIWVWQLADALQAQGVPAARLVKDAGISDKEWQSKSDRLAFEKIARFFEIAASVMDDETLGHNFGQTREIQDVGLLGYVGLSSATLGDTLRNVSRYRHVFSDAIEVDVSDLGSKQTLRWFFRIAPSIRHRQFAEFSASNLISAARTITRRQITPESVTFSHPRNTEFRPFSTFHECPVRFGGGTNSIIFRIDDLEAPVLSSDPRLLRVLKDHCELVLAKIGKGRPALVESVQREMADRLSKGEARLDIVSRALGVSPRTLSRRLNACGTSFERLRDELRKGLALQYLEDGSHSNAEIAFLLGYTETSSFSHASMRWFGKAPGEIRRTPL